MLCDAHNHLHDARLAPFLDEILPTLDAANIRRAMVNGTCEADWSAVEAVCQRWSGAHPSFGLHPWKVTDRSPAWDQKLERLLEHHPRAGVGEVGLDRWIPDYDLPDQLRVFERQLELAEKWQRPVSIHCLRAWGALFETIQKHAARLPGFLLHSYGGPAEMVEPFVKLGAFFSFSPGFLKPGKEAKRAVFQTIPADRLLIETDAPDMAPPADLTRHTLPDSNLNHPANLVVALEALAQLRSIPTADLAAITSRNYTRLFDFNLPKLHGAAPANPA